MLEFLAFQNRGHETVSSLFARYELVRNRARTEANFDLPIEACALQILRALRIEIPDMIYYLRQFNMRLPSTEEELVRRQQDVRRERRITEHAPLVNTSWATDRHHLMLISSKMATNLSLEHLHFQATTLSFSEIHPWKEQHLLTPP